MTAALALTLAALAARLATGRPGTPRAALRISLRVFPTGRFHV